MRLFVYEHLCASADADLSPSLLREGRAMLDAVLTDFALCPDVTIVPTPGQADFSLIIAPEFEDILARRCEWAIRAGSRLLGPVPATIRLTADKLACAEFLLAHGIRTPASWAAQDVAPTTYPLVVKPRCGAGSQNTQLVRDPKEYHACRAVPNPDAAGWEWDRIVQPFVPGRAASISVLAWDDQMFPLAACVQVLSDDGAFRYLGGRGPLGPGYQTRAEALARQVVAAVPGLTGYFGMDLILGSAVDGSEDTVIEINPRLTTSYIGLRRMVRGNLMQTLIDLVRGRQVAAPRWGSEEITFLVE